MAPVVHVMEGLIGSGLSPAGVPIVTEKKPDEVGLRFLEEIENSPAADALPDDLSYQHDHYLYGLPKKS